MPTFENVSGHELREGDQLEETGECTVAGDHEVPTEPGALRICCHCGAEFLDEDGGDE